MTGAIILAAGSSSRMGQSKQMLDIDGLPLLSKTVDSVLKAQINPVTVVLGANEKEHRGLLKGRNIDIAYNADWKHGMGSSIKCGLRSLLSNYRGLSAVLILVCDQPLLKPEIISSILLRYDETKKLIVASEYFNSPGVPVLFDKAYFQKLSALPDDQGARKLIHQNLADVALVSFPGGEIDLDTPEDYNEFISRRSKGNFRT